MVDAYTTDSVAEFTSHDDRIKLPSHHNLTRFPPYQQLFRLCLPEFMVAENQALANDTIHQLNIIEIYQKLETASCGLSDSEAAARLTRFGTNTIREEAGKPLYLKFLSNFTHLMAILLWIGGIAALIAQMPQLAIAIWMVNLINGVFSFWQEYRAEKATQALRRLLPLNVRVMRDGEETLIPAETLVPGDIMLLSEGDHISADGRVVEQAELQVDQSTLTGESHPVHRTADVVLSKTLSHVEIPNLVFAGTSVVAGTGKAVVFATAMNTEFGKIAHLTQSLSEEISPLQKELSVVTRVVTIIAVAVGILFFILAVLLAGMKPAEGFIFGLGMIVAFVPEGLLPTVTLALAMGVQRMVRRNALIKRLSAVETLGCTTVICTDKTGTLTQNEMTVRGLWLDGQSMTVSGVGYAPEGQILAGKQAVNLNITGGLRELLLAADLCNNAHLIPPENTSQHWSVLGDPTEAALKVAALKGGLDLKAEESKLPRLRELPFDSRRKRMSTIHNIQDDSAQQIVYVKGAPGEVLNLCSYTLRDGQSHPLTPFARDQIVAANDAYARDGLRVLAVAMRHMPRHSSPSSSYTAENIERDLTFLGLIAMMDPPRPEVAQAVEKCHRAGIRIVMITGDYGLTGESIARRIGIVRDEHPRIITGVELDTLSDDELKAAFSSEVIFARVAPEHKLRVVSVLQTMGEVVAVTGDGVNDAPALKKADIGVAMGVAGTDVAKEAADIILTDDNFASIVNAIEEGRAVYANIKKFTSYIFTSNAPEAVPFILFAFSGGRIPLALNVMHILSIDLGTDMVPALALGSEAPEPNVMDKPPRSLGEHVITRSLLLRAYIWLGLIQSLAAMAAFYFMYWTHGYWGQWTDLPSSGELYRAATAMALAAVVATQIGNVFAHRTERASILRVGFFSNRLVWVGVLTELTLIFLIVYAPFLQQFIGTAAFPLQNWLFLFAWTPSLLLVDEFRKMLVRRRSISGGLK